MRPATMAARFGNRPSAFSNSHAGTYSVNSRSSPIDLQDGEECFLRDLDAPNPFHALLAFLLFLEQLALARDVATVTLREDVLAERFDRLTRDDLCPDRRLNGDLEELARNELAHLLDDRAAARVRNLRVHDERERVDRLA